MEASSQTFEADFLTARHLLNERESPRLLWGRVYQIDAEAFSDVCKLPDLLQQTTLTMVFLLKTPRVPSIFITSVMNPSLDS